MLDIFSGLRLVVKRRSISIDNAIFRCHWFFTSTLLVSFSLVITARQYVGQPIECHSIDKIPDSLLNSYCWVQSTFSVPQACNQQVGLEVPYPCIDNTRGREVRMFAYYQWVGMVLFIQGLLFHLPYYLWKVWENGLIRAITGGLRVAVLSDQERAKKKEIVIDYIHDHLGCHKRYALKYFLCEFICLVNLMGQLWATNKFFDGQFLRYGLDVMHYSSLSLSSSGDGSSSSSSRSSLTLAGGQNNSTSLLQPSPMLSSSAALSTSQPKSISSRSSGINQLPKSRQLDPMTYIFPRITKCTYYDFGSSGDVQKHDALCLLPLNIINEKIYIALWFWFIILGLLTLLVIIYRLLAILSENVRCKGLISRCKLSRESDIRDICRHCDVGDWFLFYMVAENLDPLIMREIVASIADKIRQHFKLKRELGLMSPEDAEESAADYKYKAFAATGARYRTTGQQSSSFDAATESQSSTRRNSLADEYPLVKKVKKRSYSKRLWSIDLGPAELRQHLFGQQPPTNPDPRYQQQEQPSSYHQGHLHAGGGEQTTAGLVVVSAPPSSEMPLGSAGPAPHLQRRGSLTRAGSTSSSGTASTSESFVMEMQTISSSGPRLDDEIPDGVRNFEQRRMSVNFRSAAAAGELPLLRHRSHHQSIASMRELRLNSLPAPENENRNSTHARGANILESA